MSLAYLKRRQFFDRAINAVEDLYLESLRDHATRANSPFVVIFEKLRIQKRAFLFENQEEALECGDLRYSDTFEKNDCGGYDYTNGFTFPLEDTGDIICAAETYHGGQGSALYRLQCGVDFTPSTIRAAHDELKACLDRPYHAMSATTQDLQALEDLARWAEGASKIRIGEDWEDND